MFLWIQDAPLLGGIILKLIKLWVDKVHSGTYYEETGGKKAAKGFAWLAFLKLMHLP